MDTDHPPRPPRPRNQNPDMSPTNRTCSIQDIPGSIELKQRLWKMKSPPKLKQFLWRMLSQSLPVGSNLKRRHITPDALCKRCFQEEETDSHIFFECPYAKMIRRASV
ncbi:hypothetical protein Bca52824_033131 [Brassica carinata]|uniref:Reverse transcriptase zinc-binding domain-containing protein n=1 Tax=Brassica carinata TaxID=52824 RepID=A0A8X7SFF9_BRACI|nr:hypothetical protein Bca52824_033131 [Brassica carinata]